MGWYDEAIQNKQDYLEHHGVLGQRWGIRRYQNKDGSLTELGRKRASEGSEGVSKVLKKGQADARNIRIGGKIRGLGAQAVLTVGTPAAGAALGGLTGNPAAVLGGTLGGAIGGAGAGKAVRTIIEMHANEKAAALSQEYQLLGQKMVDECKDVKVKDIASDKYKKAYKDYVDAEDNFQKNGESKKAASSATKASDKEYEAWNKAKEAGLTDKEISKLQDDVINKRSVAVPISKSEVVADAYHKNGIYTMEYNTSDGKRHIDPIKDENTAMVILKDAAFKEQQKAINASKKN